MIIAIDGPAASGKGTLARLLAKEFDFALMDTGLLYRGVALIMLRNGQRLDSEEAAAKVASSLTPPELERLAKDPEIRMEEAAKGSALVAKYPAVRAALLEVQRAFAENPAFPDGTKAKGAVLDGRDIGTVICPEAPVKLFITASPEERARRRFLEYQDKGEPASYDTILEDIKKRDEQDRSRKVAPLVPALDAFLIDTSASDIQTVFKKALNYARQKLKI